MSDYPQDDQEIMDVDHREEVLKGKTPRRLLWIIGGFFLTLLLGIAVFIVQGNEPERRQNEDAVKADKAKQEGESAPKIVESIAAEQSKEVLDQVRGGDDRTLTDEIKTLKGSDQPSNSNVSNQHHESAAEARNQDRIKTAPIFKGGGARTAQQFPNEPSNSNYDLQKEITRLGQQQVEKTQSQVRNSEVLNQALAASGGVAKSKSSADGEMEFNAQMESKKLPAPTGVMERSNSKCLLRPGWIIPVSNIEKMNSDIPGEITLVVRQNVYGSYNNNCLAIPAGTTIIATYNPNIAIGQERFNTAATVMHLPNGERVSMMGTNAYESDGSAGVVADVNNHFFKIVGTSLLLGVASRLAGNDTITTSSGTGGTTTTGSTLSKVIAESAEVVLNRQKNIRPTLEREQATRFNLKVSREFFMKDYRE